ncbi:hypothetical protein RND71_011674 [Anisodus tanguticus]|uniref:Uncharacterized protein n=1 Tax=Anisodus tanguticus TaxID=243964 RepID=A0AAE1VGA4_9SOLA|nr:hypothetical protein RND71_011674 [Anisodus tanguticus]
MKKLWEELSTLSDKTHCSCTYTCGAKEQVQNVEQDRRLIQFLMGLASPDHSESADQEERKEEVFSLDKASDTMSIISSQ